MSEAGKKNAEPEIVKLVPRGAPEEFWWVCPPDQTPLEKIESELMEARHRVLEHRPRGGEEKPISIYAADLKNFKLFAVNQVACDLMGYTPRELLSLNPLQFIHPDDHLKLIERTANIRRGEPVQDKVEFKLKDKKRRVLRALLRVKFIYEKEKAVRVVVIGEVISRGEGTYRTVFRELLAKLGFSNPAASS